MLRISIKNEKGIETNAAEYKTEAEINEWYSFNKDYFPKPHTKDILSLAEEKLKALRIKESNDALNLGFDLVAKIRAINRRKLKLGLWTQEKFNQLLSNQTGLQIERALWNGSLTTAAYLITNLSDFYSDIEIQEIINEINAHESKWSTLI